MVTLCVGRAAIIAAASGVCRGTALPAAPTSADSDAERQRGHSGDQRQEYGDGPGDRRGGDPRDDRYRRFLRDLYEAELALHEILGGEVATGEGCGAEGKTDDQHGGLLNDEETYSASYATCQDAVSATNLASMSASRTVRVAAV